MFRVLIVGGGIGGMTAAACLLNAGISVAVFEQAKELGEVGAGIQLSANAMRVLGHLNLIDEVSRRGVKPEAYQFKMFDTAEILQEIPLGE